MNERDIKQALRTWIRNISRLADDKIVWSEQDVSRLSGQFITMRLGDLTALGSADEVTHDYDATRDAGQEIEITVNGQRSLVLSLQCFGEASQTPRSVLSTLKTSLSLPSVLDLFEAAGLSCYDTGPIQNITALLETIFEPRAAMEIYLYCSEIVSERTTFVETVTVEDEINTTTFTIPEE